MSMSNGLELENDGYQPLDKTYSTRAIHVSLEENQQSNAVVPPITLSSNFRLNENSDISKGYFYSRFGNPNRELLEKCIATLDNAKFGLCYPSGLSSILAMTSLLRPGDHIICGTDVYGGTSNQFNSITREQGIEVSRVDVLKPGCLEENFKSNTKLVWIESHCNPIGKLVDVRQVVKICKTKPGVILTVDNTFLTSYFLKPLELGVDVAMYSLTKYMNGHSDVIMGALVTNNEELHTKLRHQQQYLGIVPSPFDCYLVCRGIKTMALRMREHMKNAIHVGKFLKNHQHVEKVCYPGLPDDPQNALLKSMASGCDGVMSFSIKNAEIIEVKKFLNALKIFENAGSVGGFESLACSPLIVTHFTLPKEERIKIGVTDNLIRLSIGLEEPEELCNDLNQALKAAFV